MESICLHSACATWCPKHVARSKLGAKGPRQVDAHATHLLPEIKWDVHQKLDDGWPESAEEQVTLVLLELVHKRTVVNVLILIQLMNRKEMR